MLSIFNISSTGINFYKNSLDAIAHNVANVNTVRTMEEGAVRRQSVVGTADTSPAPSMIGTGGTVGGGVSFKMVESSSAVGLVTYDPENVLANADGYVRRPDIDLTTEMADMIIAQRGYQANLAVVQRATEAYQAALQLGR
jgi:flagellar basal-body rod protein FlgC